MLRANEQVTVDVVGHPPGQLLDVADPGDDLDDASGQIRDQWSWIGKVARGRAFPDEERVGVDEFARRRGKR